MKFWPEAADGSNVAYADVQCPNQEFYSRCEDAEPCFFCLFRVIVCSSLIQIITTKKYILQSFIHMHVLLSRQRWVNTKNTHFLRGCLGGGVSKKGRKLRYSEQSSLYKYRKSYYCLICVKRTIMTSLI